MHVGKRGCMNGLENRRPIRSRRINKESNPPKRRTDNFNKRLLMGEEGTPPQRGPHVGNTVPGGRTPFTKEKKKDLFKGHRGPWKGEEGKTDHPSNPKKICSQMGGKEEKRKWQSSHCVNELGPQESLSELQILKKQLQESTGISIQKTNENFTIEVPNPPAPLRDKKKKKKKKQSINPENRSQLILYKREFLRGYSKRITKKIKWIIARLLGKRKGSNGLTV